MQIKSVNENHDINKKTFSHTNNIIWLKSEVVAFLLADNQINFPQAHKTC